MQRSNDEVQQHGHDEVQQSSENYAFMCKNRMAMIQEYLVLSDDKQREALESLAFVQSTAQQRLHDDNRICIWREDV